MEITWEGKGPESSGVERDAGSPRVPPRPTSQTCNPVVLDVSAPHYLTAAACTTPEETRRNSHPAQLQLAHRTVRDNKMAVVLRWFVMQHKITETGTLNHLLSGQPLPAQVPAY